MSAKPERRFQSYPSRFREVGTVHRYIWSYENKTWYVACRGPWKDPHGAEVLRDTLVSCKKCAR